MTRGSWEPGDVVVWWEAWRGRMYGAFPVRVVEDTDERLVTYVAEGTRFLFPPGAWPFDDEHPWAARGGWTGHGVLIQHRPGTAHTIWHFWEGDERRFWGWYVNMQAPYRRVGRTYKSQDHEVDLWVTADGSWEWKDEDQLEAWKPRGRFTEDEVREIRAEGERVLAEWPFPTGWENWSPDPSWAVPAELPADWRPPE
jgi:Protein of unknown function (DUF402)